MDKAFLEEISSSFEEEIGGIFQTTSALSDSGIRTLFENIGKTVLVPGFDYKANEKTKPFRPRLVNVNNEV